MDEENKQEKAEPESTTPDNDAGVQSETESLIEQSNKASERQEKATEAMKKENDRAEKIAIKTQLAGKGSAVVTPPTPIDKEAAAAQERILEVGRATGAKWAQSKEEKPEVPLENLIK